MDALTKAVVLLWQDNRLLERECGDIRSHVDAIGDLIALYLREAKIDDNQYPETSAALDKVIKSLEDRVSNIERLHHERVKIMDAMLKVYMDLAIDPAATLQ